MDYRKKITLFSIILFSTLTTYSQKIFREGYVIKNNKDTLNGIIQFSESSKAPQKCIFKRFDIAITIEYTPYEIKAFGYKNGIS